jgi:hypothetical protein
MTQETLPAADRHFIVRAAQYLENPGFLIRVANVLGQPLEIFAQKVPDRIKEVVDNALRKTMDMAIRTVPKGGLLDTDMKAAESQAFWSGLKHTVALAATGAAGGMFGMAGLAVELPISTGLLFRSIARIAGDFDEDLRDPATRLECLSIFSYGGPITEENAMESSYLSTRLGLTVAIRQASQALAGATADELTDILTRGTASAVLQLLARIAPRFNMVVSEKFIAESVPVLGALGGSIVNAAFADHFNTVARYHFGIRKLERRYGAETVQAFYRESLKVARERGPALRPTLEVS